MTSMLSPNEKPEAPAGGAVRVKVVRVANRGEALPLPRYQTEGSVGADLCADLEHPLQLRPMQRALVPTGFSIEIPPGYEGQIRPRSGLALRSGLSMPNPPGTIDSDYRGEVCVLMINFGEEPVEIRRGDRVAQLVIAPVAHVRFEEADSLSETRRGEGGFGHTGR
jgi:dUTP pyrophosphatase